jgi:hypothetical protein
VLFQGAALFDSISAYENVAFPLRYFTDYSESKIRKRVLESLDQVNLKDIGDKSTAALSGGMRKRVGLARAIRKLADERLGVTLALSLHAPDDELRDTLVPVNNRWKVSEALDAARYYADATGRRVSTRTKPSRVAAVASTRTIVSSATARSTPVSHLAQAPACPARCVTDVRTPRPLATDGASSAQYPWPAPTSSFYAREGWKSIEHAPITVRSVSPSKLPGSALSVAALMPDRCTRIAGSLSPRSRLRRRADDMAWLAVH